MYLLPANGKEKVIEVNLSDGTQAYVYGKLLGNRLQDPHDIVTGSNKGYANGFYVKAFKTNARTGDPIEINTMQITSFIVTSVDLPNNIVTYIATIRDYDAKVSNGETPEDTETDSYNDAISYINTYFN